jgi:Calx-beta domain
MPKARTTWTAVARLLVLAATVSLVTVVPTISSSSADTAPTISIDRQAIVPEGDSGAHSVTLNVTLSAPSMTTVTVDYATGGGTAQAGSDYEPALGTLTFTAGDTTQSIDLAVVGDTVYERYESFGVTLSNPQGTTIAQAASAVWITNDDPKPTISASDATRFEGDSGTTQFWFWITLSNPSSFPTTVSYSTADGTARARRDYTPTSGRLTIPAGKKSGRVIVYVHGDTLLENNETFYVDLTSPTNAIVARSRAVGTILNEETPAITISQGYPPEGPNYEFAEANEPVTFDVKLSATSGYTVQVDYATVDGTQTAPDGYTPAAGTLVFAPGESTKKIIVQTGAYQGGPCDPFTSFNVNLSRPSNATMDVSSAVAMMADMSVVDCL